MSERSRSAQTGSSIVEGASSLPGLSATSEPDHDAQSMTQPANQSDLATASISSKDIMRVSQRVESRKNLRPLTHDQSASDTRAAPRRGTTPPSNGILNNPTYAYGGDLLTRFITLLANILKFVERLFLRLLSGPDSSAATPPSQNASRNKEHPSRPQVEQEREKKERKNKEHSNAQTIRRG